jgi:hypothetical protein
MRPMEPSDPLKPSTPQEGQVTTTEAPTPPKVQERLPKPLRELQRKLKQGYRFEQTGSNHYRVRDTKGDRLVEYRGRPFQISMSPSPGVVRGAEEELREALALKGTAQRPPTPEAEKRKREANVAIQRERQRKRQAQATALRKRFAAVFNRMNGLGTPGLSGDVGRVGALLLRDMEVNGRRLKTPDLLVQNAHRMLNGGWVEPEYAAIWETLIARLEDAPNAVGEWFTLVREARGLPADTVSVRLPKDSESDWPFRVELLPLDALLVDESYQRPVDWPFVRKEAARFDSSLVGTIDVAQRSPSSFAILDGQQRSQIVRLVGKSSIYCSIYVGLDAESEARYFLHKNANRKSVHPWYTFRATVASGDAAARETQAIVERHGYVLAIGAPNERRERNISAISAVTSSYARKMPDGTSVLDPVLDTLKRSTLGRDHGQDSILIRGMALVYQQQPDADRDLLVETLVELGPGLIIGRARDSTHGGRSAAQAVADVVISEHRRRARRRAS